MPRWTEGYATDIFAAQRFRRELAPVWLATACTLLGQRAPDPTRALRYADLGCGSGLTALTIAAVCPKAEVWGFDFNPAHVEAGRELADRAGLTNIRFVERAFSALAGDALPEFDVIVADRVLSVVSPDNRRHVIEFMARHLRPGGLACLGYTAATGWTEFVPLQTAMRQQAAASVEPADLAVPDVLAYLDRVRLAGAQYFARNPAVGDRLASMTGWDPIDLANEFLNENWHPLMFADVAEAMAESKCDFIGRATLHENIDQYAVQPGMVPLLEAASSVRMRETMQDIAARTSYRRDIYRRGLTGLPVAEHRAALAAMTVAGLRVAGDGPVTLPSWQGPIVPDAAHYQLLLEALRAGPLSVGAASALTGGDVEAAAQAIAMLISAGAAHPVMPDAAVQDAGAGTARLNRAIVAAVARGDEVGFLVSPLIGSAIAVSALEALVVGALIEDRDPADLDGLTRAVLIAMRLGGRPVMRAGEPVDDDAEATVLLRAGLAEILERRVPLFRALRILPEV